MATVTRTPFAPLNEARLQTLTSLKNRQNAITPPTAVKRKAAESVEVDDSENVDPLQFSKRSKGGDSSSFFPTKDFLKPSHFVLTKAASTPVITTSANVIASPIRKIATPRSRSLLQGKTPAARLNTSIAKSSPLSAPAGRSPTRGSKRIGISNRRRTTSSFSRVDPPSFSLGGGAPFSLDAALKGTIPSYASRSSAASAPLEDVKSSWDFVIHEDTPEQEMTNLLQHSTCVLDISSDEESEQKLRRERAEGRDKENIPPIDDVSQTSSSAVARARAAAGSGDDMVIEKQRDPLGQLNTADYYAAGCHEASVIIVPGDEDVEEEAAPEVTCEPAPLLPSSFASSEQEPLVSDDFQFAPEVKLAEDSFTATVEEIMGDSIAPAAKAALLEPMEGTGESFELWESGSAKDEAEPVSAPSPAPVLDEAVALS